MHISISGSGIPIVFIHGYCENSTIWNYFEQALSKNFQVVLIDLPGHGKSQLPSNSFTIDDISDLVLASLEENGIDEFFVIGHSLGGYISLALAELYPEKILGFGLFSSTTYADDDEKKIARDKVGNFIAEHGVDKFIEPFVPNLFASSNRKRLAKEIAELKEIGKKISPQSIIGYAQAMKNRPDRTHLLAHFDKPKFIIGGDRDMAVKEETSKNMIDLLENGEGIILKNTGHNGYVESPIESLSFIELFLSKNFS
ncbi:MAG: alpha/beta hydrolase [Reichenbachiella sp.]